MRDCSLFLLSWYLLVRHLGPLSQLFRLSINDAILLLLLLFRSYVLVFGQLGCFVSRAVFPVWRPLSSVDAVCQRHTIDVCVVGGNDGLVEIGTFEAVEEGEDAALFAEVVVDYCPLLASAAVITGSRSVSRG